MSVLENIFAIETSISDLVNPQYWMTDALSGARTQSGETVSPNTAVGLAAYYACLHAISEDVGALPFLTYRRLKPRGKERAPDHPLYRMLHTEANPETSAQVLRETMTGHALGWGNGYAEIQRGGDGTPQALSLIHPSKVTLKRTEDGKLYYDIRSGGAPPVSLRPENVLHIHGLGDDGVTGYSVATIGAESLGLTLAAQTFGASFFGNGASLGGVLEHPAVLSDKAREHLRSTWRDLYQGAKKTGSIAILEEGLKFSKISIPPEEAQFLQSRQFQIEEVCRWFRMPPHKIQHLLHASYNSIEHQSIEYVRDTLTPWLVRWEQEVARKLFGSEEDEYFAEHLVTGLLRGDSAARSAFFRERFMIGTLSQNDIREIENENPIGPDGDTYYIPSNMTRSEDAARGWIASAAGPPSSTEEEAEPEEEPEEEDVEPEEEEEPEEDTGEDTESERRAEIRQTFLPVFQDAISRVMRKESKALDRAVAKYAGDASAFSAWLDEFLPEQRVFLFEATMPGVLAIARALRLPYPPLGDRLSASADEIIESCRKYATAVLEGKDVEAFAARLEMTTNKLLDKVMQS